MKAGGGITVEVGLVSNNDDALEIAVQIGGHRGVN
jgi:hypothetical protein